MDEVTRQKELIRQHATLYRKWKDEKLPCIICGVREGSTKDHLPPKGLFPKSREIENPNFLTYRVCEPCNGGSKDSDYLLGVYLAIFLNQSSYLRHEEPSDPDLLALHDDAVARLSSEDEGDRRIGLLKPHIHFNEKVGAYGLNPDKLEVHLCLVKIVKAIYWLQSKGDILESYDPGWWIFPRIDTSEPNYIERYLKTSNAEIHWDDRFIAHYNVGFNENKVGGFIACSLHFYTNRVAGHGANWHLIAAPRKTQVDGESLYVSVKKLFGQDFYHSSL